MVFAAPRVLVLAPNWLGDAVMALPAIADLRRHLRPSRLVVASRRSVAGLFPLVPGVDEVITLAWGGRLRRLHGLGADVRALRGVRADVAVLLPNSFASAWLAWRARVPQRWGYAGDLRSRLLTRAVAKPARSVHQGRYYQQLLEACGVPAGPLEPVLAVPDAAIGAMQARLGALGWNGRAPLVAVAPGAAYGTAKRWPSDRFAHVAAALVETRDAWCVLVGSGGDAGATAAVRALVPDRVRDRVVDLAGRTTLEELAAILAMASACLTNDSGAMHLASASGAPLAAVFGPTREDETAPLARGDRPAEVVVHPVSCRPCMLRECPIDHRCMTGIEPARVYDVVAALLREPRTGPRHA
jgi:heptosyltransferase II